MQIFVIWLRICSRSWSSNTKIKHSTFSASGAPNMRLTALWLVLCLFSLSISCAVLQMCVSSVFFLCPVSYWDGPNFRAVMHCKVCHLHYDVHTPICTVSCNTVVGDSSSSHWACGQAWVQLFTKHSFLGAFYSGRCVQSSTTDHTWFSLLVWQLQASITAIEAQL